MWIGIKKRKREIVAGLHKTTESISMKFGGGVGLDQRKNSLHFGIYPYKRTDTGMVSYFIYYGEIALALALADVCAPS